MTRETSETPRPYDRQIFWLLAVVVVCAAFGLRMRGADEVMRPDGTIRFGDADTMRRLERLDAIGRSSSYPVVETKDGFPDGTVSHWTRPFDWFLQGLDSLASPFVTGAHGYEAAAVFAGPVLGTICVILFLWGAVLMLGRMSGLLAATFYALQFPLLHTCAVGNGDHQNLQHLFLLVFCGLWLLGHLGRLGTKGAAISGLALGLGIWVSTESMVFCLGYITVTGILIVLGSALRGEQWKGIAPDLSHELARGAGLLVAMFLGMVCEQPGYFALEWDKISWFQIYPVLVFGLFLVSTKFLPDFRFRPVVAAAFALGLGLLGLLPGLGAAVEAQLAMFDDVNVWLQNVVTEFRPSFWNGKEYSITEGTRRFTFMLVTLPVFAAAAIAATGMSLRARIVLVAATMITFGLAAWEVKLGHLFAIFYPLAMVVGGTVVRNRFCTSSASSITVCNVVFAALLITGGILGLPKPTSPSIQNNNRAVSELCEFLRSRQGNREGAVIAPWSLGAAIMYHGGWPVVGSGYHRNIEGIRDGYRFFTSQPHEGELADEIVHRRKVDYVVMWYSRTFFEDARRVLGDGRVYQTDSRTFTDTAKNSLFWRLRYTNRVPGYRVVYSSKSLIRLFDQTRTHAAVHGSAGYPR